MPKAWRNLDTDFPNYYLAARMVHEGYDTSRMYEWAWIQREKDHRAIDIRVIGMLPITPFSTLAMYPLARMEPLKAKRIFILLNLAFLVPLAWMLRSMTSLSYQKISLIILLSFPLHRNLLYGQFYILLLLLIVAGCFSYLRGHSAVAGSLIAVAALCKVFPALLFVFFLQRRDWRALLSGAVTAVVACAVSIAAFGWSVHRTWLQEIFPWVARGEGLGTYATSDSISGLLHRLFLPEPQWNPHPWHNSPLAYAVLMATAQMLVLAPAILLLRRDNSDQKRTLLIWSALLTAALAVSTIPASYNFVLMIFPACVAVAVLQEKGRTCLAALLLLVYALIGLPIPATHAALHASRLPLMLIVLLTLCTLLRLEAERSKPDWMNYAWGACMILGIAFAIPMTLRQQVGERKEFPYRVPTQASGFLYANPAATEDGIEFSLFTTQGYKLISDRETIPTPEDNAAFDDLSFTSFPGHTIVERAGGKGSNLIDPLSPGQVVVANAEAPAVSTDGKNLAFLRSEHGRGELVYRRLFRGSNDEVVLTPPNLNVYEFSFLSIDNYAFSASEGDGPPRIYLSQGSLRNQAIVFNASRYPALSPDARFLAYSRFEHGSWNLWVRDQRTGQSRRIADVPCNQIEPSWEKDSKTILYGTDCGRSIWFTAVARRRVVP